MNKNVSVAPNSVLPVFEQLRLEYDHQNQAIWIFMNPKDRPSFTLPLLNDLHAVFSWLPLKHQQMTEAGSTPFRFVVTASGIPGVYNLGGDLPHFVDLINKKDEAGLRHYAHLCIEIQYRRHTNFGLPIVTISLTQGDTLGGGFECALSDDLIIAEQQSKFGFPEARFNLFPGMGAFSFLRRRIGDTLTRKMIESGQLFDAQEMFDLGLVARIAPEGEGAETVNDHIRILSKNFNSRQSIERARRISSPIPKQELIDITDLWVESALRQGPKDLRKMKTFAVAQDRLLANLHGSYVIANSKAEAQRLSDQSEIYEVPTTQKLREAGLKPHMNCLDVGMGEGSVTKLIGQKTQDGSVTGIDLNEELGSRVIAELNKSQKSDFYFVHGDVEDLTTIQDESFDFTFARFLLIHQENPLVTLKRMWAWTKPGGSLLVMDYDFDTMTSTPEHEAIDDLKQVLIDVFTDAELDPFVGRKLPLLFEESGIGVPDDVDAYTSQKKTVNLRRVLSATYDSFLPRAIAIGATTQERSDQFIEELDKMAKSGSHYFTIPTLYSAWKRKPHR